MSICPDGPLLVFLLATILKLAKGDICYYYVNNFKNVTSSTSCDDCCESIASSVATACCDKYTPSFMWAVPFIVLIVCCLILATISGLYTFCCTKKPGMSETSSTANESAIQSRLDLDRVSSTNTVNSTRSIRSTAARYSSTSEVKPPQRIDVTTLPTYSQASKMRSESPPNYSDLYTSNRVSQINNSNN